MLRIRAREAFEAGGFIDLLRDIDDLIGLYQAADTLGKGEEQKDGPKEDK